MASFNKGVVCARAVNSTHGMQLFVLLYDLEKNSQII